MYLGERKEDVMAFIVGMTLSLTYQLHKERLVQSSWWKADQVAMTEMMKNEGMRLYWERYKHVYQRDFAQFIDKILQEPDSKKPNFSSAPQSEQPVPSRDN
jgi:hypothetical protein